MPVLVGIMGKFKQISDTETHVIIVNLHKNNKVSMYVQSETNPQNLFTALFGLKIYLIWYLVLKNKKWKSKKTRKKMMLMMTKIKNRKKMKQSHFWMQPQLVECLKNL